MADPVITISNFSVGGKSQGTINLPCDGGQTQITISVTIKARIDAGAAVVVPVWIGELSVFNSDNLIEDIFTLVNNWNKRTWVYKTKNYSLHCSKGCMLTPGGPGTAKYTVNGSEMTLSCGFFNQFGVGFPFISWWYDMNKITVKCVESAAGITYAMLDDSKMKDLMVAEKLNDLALLAAKGNEVIVNEKGELICVANAKVDNCDEEQKT